MPKGTTVALLNDPAVEPEPFLYQAAHHHLSDGDTVVYMVFDRPPSAVARGMKEFGFPPDKTKGRFHVIDAYSGLTGSTEGSQPTLQNPRDLKEVAAEVARLAKSYPGALLILDSLSTLMDQVDPRRVSEAVHTLAPTFKRFRLTLATLTRWPYGEELDQLAGRFDATVSLRAVQDRVVVNQYFKVERAHWAKSLDTKPVLYKANKPGGVLAYIPKIVVTGPYHAGKSTFVQTLSDTAVSVNRLGTTIALDHGHITIDGLGADLFGTAGQERFDPLLKTIAGQALGVILVVDSTRPDTFPRAREMLNLTGREGLPSIVAANKQDDAAALDPDEVRRRLSIPEHIQVVGCTAKDRKATLAVLRSLLDRIMFKVSA